MPVLVDDLPSPRGIIFDLDGTLVDTVETRIRAWLNVFEAEGIPATRRQVAELIGSDGRQLARDVAAAAAIVLAEGRDEAIDARCGALFAEWNTDPRPLPGATSLIARLEVAGVPWAIATSSRREQVAASVAALELPRAPLVVDGTHVAHAKPAPDLLLLAAHELGIDPPECWYVGDATPDMRAAVAAGMVAIGVPTGAVDENALRAAGADRVVASLGDIVI